MKNRFVLFLALIAITLPVSRSSAQTAAQAPSPGQPPLVTSAPSLSVAQGQNYRYIYARDPQQMAKFQEAMNAYKEAESESDKSAAKKTLHDLLSEQYDNSLSRYEEHLNDLEKKIESMREQLARRRNAKEAVVDLKLDMVISEADGLGWPDDGGASNLFFPEAVGGWGGIPFSSPIAPLVEVQGVPAPNTRAGGRAR